MFVLKSYRVIHCKYILHILPSAEPVLVGLGMSKPCSVDGVRQQGLVPDSGDAFTYEKGLVITPATFFFVVEWNGYQEVCFFKPATGLQHSSHHPAQKITHFTVLFVFQLHQQVLQERLFGEVISGACLYQRQPSVKYLFNGIAREAEETCFRQL